MTVGRPRDPTNVPALRAPAAGAADAADPLEYVDGLEAAGVLGVRAGGRDVISLSAQAQMLMRAGLRVRAFVSDAIAFTYRSIALGTRTIVLEYGVYR